MQSCLEILPVITESYTNLHLPLAFREISGQSMIKNQSKEWIPQHGTIGALKLAMYLTGKQTKADFVLQIG
jgi:hypothetical protein